MVAGIVAVVLLWLVVGYALVRMGAFRRSATASELDWGRASYAIGQTGLIVVGLIVLAALGHWIAAAILLPFVVAGAAWIRTRASAPS